MKTTLTKDDPSGWYECRGEYDEDYAIFLYWTGKELRAHLDSGRLEGSYTNFRRLFTESDVAALNEELRTLREELRKSENHCQLLNRDYSLVIKERDDFQRKLKTCELYAASFQKQADDLSEKVKLLETGLSLRSSQREDIPPLKWSRFRSFHYADGKDGSFEIAIIADCVLCLSLNGKTCGLFESLDAAKQCAEAVNKGAFSHHE